MYCAQLQCTDSIIKVVVTANENDFCMACIIMTAVHRLPRQKHVLWPRSTSRLPSGVVACFLTLLHMRKREKQMECTWKQMDTMH